MRLYAISDLHLANKPTVEYLRSTPEYPDDWLVVAGDVGEREEHLQTAWQILTQRFAHVLWVPGNHELWHTPGEAAGEAKYQTLVDVCRSYDVRTPEDPYAIFESQSGTYRIALMFLLYDYSFRPDDIAFEDALDWAKADQVMCVDERKLLPHPHASRHDWCRARCNSTSDRLDRESTDYPTILVNHWPLRQELARLPRIPRFSLWCGTRITEQWHRRFGADVVIYGHLHIRKTCTIDNVRFEEVSLGYPKQYDATRPITDYLRRIV